MKALPGEAGRTLPAAADVPSREVPGWAGDTDASHIEADVGQQTIEALVPGARLVERDPGAAERTQAGIEIAVNPYLGEVVVVEARALQTLVIEAEAEWFHQMQRRSGVGAQPDCVARIGRYFGFIQDEVDH